jgi:hypothetical protein
MTGKAYLTALAEAKGFTTTGNFIESGDTVRTEHINPSVIRCSTACSCELLGMKYLLRVREWRDLCPDLYIFHNYEVVKAIHFRDLDELLEQFNMADIYAATLLRGVL